MDELNIGKKLLEFRESKGFTLRELAQKTSLTPSMLSQLERGLVNPSINTLRVIAMALEVPLFRFFQEDEDNRSLIVRKGMRKTIGQPGQSDVEYDLLTPNVSGSIEFCMMHIPPKSNSGEGSQRHDGEEVAYVLSGRVTLLLDGTPETLEAGDSVRIPPRMVHCWENPGDEEVQVIFAVTPPSF